MNKKTYTTEEKIAYYEGMVEHALQRLVFLTSKKVDDQIQLEKKKILEKILKAR